MGLLSSFIRSSRMNHVVSSSSNISTDTDLIQKNLVTMGKHLEEQNAVIISRLDDICKMLYDLTKHELDIKDSDSDYKFK